MNDLNSKLGLVVKEAKTSAQTVKLGEKQIDSITEKMDAFRQENVKFKQYVKERMYEIERKMNEAKVQQETEVYRLRTKTEEQLEGQQRVFDKALANC
jgi:hypothetical protein